MGGTKTYPYGSTSTVRGHVLAALGVLKVATADQMYRLTAPGHKDNKAFRNACLDLARHGLVMSEGSARTGGKLWGLTPLGLEAASEVLGRHVGEMGGTARGAARSGAPHAMAVNETVIALTRTPPAPTQPLHGGSPPAVPHAPADADADAGVDVVGDVVPAGLGTVAAWSTEVTHHLPSTGRSRAAVRADAVVHAPEAGVPVLLVEVDNCTESEAVLAAKFERYRRFFRLKTKDTHGKDPAGRDLQDRDGPGPVPVWRTLYPATGREGYPPVAVVFNPGTRLGEQALKNRMNRIAEATRGVWSGEYHRTRSYGQADGYCDYGDAIPLLLTTLPRLQQHGPHGPVWWRCGHGRWETLHDALDNPQDYEAWYEREEERRRLHDEHTAREQERRHEELKQWGPAVRTAEPVPAPAPTPAPTPPPVPPSPCERCNQPITSPWRTPYDDYAPPPDGRHCPECRRDIAAQPPTLRQVLFKRSRP